jgi:hypothetical protein
MVANGFTREERSLKDVGYDVYDGVWIWSNADGIKVLTADVDGGFHYFGEKIIPVIAEIVHANRLARFLNEGEIIKPNNYEYGILSYTWYPFSDETKRVLTDNPQYHIYTLVQEEGEYRIVPGKRFTGCRGYILSRKGVYIGDDGILLKNEAIPYLRSSNPITNLKGENGVAGGLLEHDEAN